MSTKRRSPYLPDLPQLKRDRWPELPSSVWRSAEPLLKPWSGKCRDACRMHGVAFGPGWLNGKTGLTAAELGAPVHQALFVGMMRERQGS